MNPQNEISSTLFISIWAVLLLQMKTPIFRWLREKVLKIAGKCDHIVLKLFNFQFHNKLTVPYLISSCDCPCGQHKQHYNSQELILKLLVGEPKSPIVQKPKFFAPERYTAGILYTDCLNSA